MNSLENPEQHLNDLQQCLSADKRPLGLFLGAGCPMAVRVADGAPLIPDVAGVTKHVCTEIDKLEECKALLRTVEAHFDDDGKTAPTIEHMLSHIRALRSVAGKAQVRELTAADLDKLDETICRLIHDVVNRELPDQETAYHDVASWIGATHRSSGVELFTSNYDLLMEQALEEVGVPYFDGFAGVRRPFFDLQAIEEDVLPARWAGLWKIHGSINWYQLPNEGVYRATANESGKTKRIIHPSHLKYEASRRMPYFAMMDRLRAFLKKPTAALVLCGYSFRDEHINEAIVQGLRASQLVGNAFALLYDKLDAYPEAVQLAKGRPNLTLLARDGAVVGTQRRSWVVRDADAVANFSDTWINWAPIAGGKRVAEFRLGDFRSFGAFLRDLLGKRANATEVQHGS